MACSQDLPPAANSSAAVAADPFIPDPDSDPGPAAPGPAAPAPVVLPARCGKAGGPAVKAATDLSKTLATLTSTPATILIDGTSWALASLNVPAAVELCFSGAGRLEIVTGATVKVTRLSSESGSWIFGSGGAVQFQGTVIKEVFPQWFGAKGDGSTDDATAFRKTLSSLTAVSGVTVKLAGKSYAMTLNPGLVVPQGNGIDGQGGAILAKLTGDKEYGYWSNSRHLFSMRSSTFLRNMTLDNIPVKRTDHTVYRHHIMVGEYSNGTGYSNVTLEGLTLKGGVEGEIGINIWGDSSNVTVRNIKYPANPNLGTAIAVQWGGVWDTIIGADGQYKKGRTTHPHHILIENVTIDSLTTLGASTDGQPASTSRANCFDVCGNWGVWISAAYNVTVRGLNIGTIGTGVEVYAGDFGSYMADASVKPLIGTNILIENVNINAATLRGFRVNGAPSYMNSNTAIGPYITQVDNGATFRNITAFGVGKAGRVYNAGYMAGQGFSTFYSRNVTLENVFFSNFAYGVEVFEAVQNLHISNSKIRLSSYGGIALLGSLSARTVNILIKGVEISDANREQSAMAEAAAISIGAGTDGVQVDSCYITAYTAYRQFVGIYLLGGAYHYLSNNYIDAVAAGGAGFGALGGTTPLWYVSNNGAAPGIPLYFGHAPIYY